MGQDLFFYGTLRDLTLLDIVMGAGVQPPQITPATLTDHAVFAAKEGPFPTILPQKGAQADGVLVRGLSPDHIARLDFYEGGFDYALVQGTLTDGTQAAFYMSPPGQWTATDPWSFDAWFDEHGAVNRLFAGEVMSHFGVYPADRIAALFPRIRARAASRARAMQSVHGEGTMKGRVDILARTRAHMGFYALDTFELRHEKFDGTLTETLNREVFVPSDAALVLPYDPQRDCVLVVEQMRMGPLGRGDQSLWQWEPVAGLIDPGETPQEAARREAREEAGVELRALEPVAQSYSSPGNSADFFYLFVGVTDLPEGTQGVSGVASEGENIRSHILAFQDLMDRVARFDITNGPLIMTALWLDKHRARLRSG